MIITVSATNKEVDYLISKFERGNKGNYDQYAEIDYYQSYQLGGYARESTDWVIEWIQEDYKDEERIEHEIEGIIELILKLLCKENGRASGNVADYLNVLLHFGKMQEVYYDEN